MPSYGVVDHWPADGASRAPRDGLGLQQDAIKVEPLNIVDIDALIAYVQAQPGRTVTGPTERRLVPLDQFGYYALAWLVAAGLGFSRVRIFIRLSFAQCIRVTAEPCRHRHFMEVWILRPGTKPGSDFTSAME